MAEGAKEVPWHTAFPAPSKETPDTITAQQLLQGIRAGKRPGIDFLLVDLRRTDHEVSKIGETHLHFRLPDECFVREEQFAARLTCPLKVYITVCRRCLSCVKRPI